MTNGTASVTERRTRARSNYAVTDRASSAWYVEALIGALLAPRFRKRFGRRGCAVCVEAPDGREVLDQRRGRPRDLGAGARRAESNFPTRRSAGEVVVGGAGGGERAYVAAVVVGGTEGGGQAASADEGRFSSPDRAVRVSFEPGPYFKHRPAFASSEKAELTPAFVEDRVLLPAFETSAGKQRLSPLLASAVDFDSCRGDALGRVDCLAVGGEAQAAAARAWAQVTAARPAGARFRV